MVSSLMIFTLFTALAVGIGLSAWHVRKPENRHPMKDRAYPNIDQIISEAPEELRRC